MAATALSFPRGNNLENDQILEKNTPNWKGIAGDVTCYRDLNNIIRLYHLICKVSSFNLFYFQLTTKWTMW